MQFLILAFTAAVTVGAYLFARRIYLKYHHPLLNVVLVGAAIVIATLLICRISYAQYLPARNILTLLLGPATVALAVPLYRNRRLLRCYLTAILVGVISGATISLVTAGLIARLGGLNSQLIASLVPKSVTVAFAIDISQINGGNPALTVVFVVATGTLGAIFGPAFLTWAGVQDPVSRGLALGTMSHGQGTAMALLEGEEQGAMAGLAVALAGVATAVLAPLLIPLLAG
jgi:predicted murein hydrolase (TIGR00659 family)